MASAPQPNWPSLPYILPSILGQATPFTHLGPDARFACQPPRSNQLTQFQGATNRFMLVNTHKHCFPHSQIHFLYLWKRGALDKIRESQSVHGIAYQRPHEEREGSSPGGWHDTSESLLCRNKSDLRNKMQPCSVILALATLSVVGKHSLCWDAMVKREHLFLRAIDIWKVIHKVVKDDVFCT